MNLLDELKKELYERIPTDETETLFLRMIKEAELFVFYRKYKEVSDLHTFKELKKREDDFKKDFLFLTVFEYSKILNCTKYGIDRYDEYFFNDLCKSLFKQFVFTDTDLTKFIEIVSNSFNRHIWTTIKKFPFAELLKVIEKRVRDNPKLANPEFIDKVKKLKFEVSHDYLSTCKKFNQKLLEIVALDNETKLSNFYSTTDGIGEAFDYFKHKFDNDTNWRQFILKLSEKAEKSTPSSKWLVEIQEIINKISVEEIRDFTSHILQKSYEYIKSLHKKQFYYGVIYLSDTNEDLLRKCLWVVPLVYDKNILSIVSGLGLVSFKKYPTLGALVPKIGNSSIYVFGTIPFNLGISFLSKFKVKTTNLNVKNLVDKYIRQLAEKENKLIEEIEELGISDYELDENHSKTVHFGQCKAILQIKPNRQVELSWFNEDEKPQKSVPISVKSNYAKELKELNQQVKEIQEMLGIQAVRIEQVYLTQRTWRFDEWKDIYLENGFLSHLSKKLIWYFEKEDKKGVGIYLNNSWIDNEEKEIDWINADTKVMLWHPLGFEINFVSNWRQIIEKYEISQPFKQAFREVYIITDAEINTNTYSNRFAAHILRQHQFAALTKIRGWQYHLMGAWDSHNTPTKRLDNWNLMVQYWVESPFEETSPTGIFNYIQSDQVRFYQTDRDWNQRTQLRMDEVPAIVFSEMMRDIDLFVGVCSIGNDPNWVNGGNRFGNDYWQSYSFGDNLGELAKTRKEVLQRLIPRLKIAKIAEIKDKFLIVKGKIRTYKIHIGSGNILMEPNDQYLCIVPDRSTSKSNPSEKLFLPFEGDNVLSIILSKAFLLADDDKITDETITRQIKS